MPTVKLGESQKDYVARCIPFVLKEGTAKDQAQAAAMCYGLFKEHHDKEKHLSLKSAFARSLMELSREAKVVACSNCKSTNVRREPGGEGAGPLDRCMNCGHWFPQKPGTITAAQKAASTPDDPMEMEGE
jgi:hypothetical protein